MGNEYRNRSRAVECEKGDKREQKCRIIPCEEGEAVLRDSGGSGG
jgi:hypothetical protein